MSILAGHVKIDNSAFVKVITMHLIYNEHSQCWMLNVLNERPIQILKTFMENFLETNEVSAMSGKVSKFFWFIFCSI